MFMETSSSTWIQVSVTAKPPVVYVTREGLDNLSTINCTTTSLLLSKILMTKWDQGRARTQITK